MSVGRFLQQAAAGAGGAGGAGDDDFANVVLLLDGDGTSGDDNNTFTDSSTNGFTVTESGSVAQGSFSPYGDNWSNYFNYSPYLTVPQNTAFNFGTGDFTVEFWANVDTYRTSGSYFDCFVAFGHYTSSPYIRITHSGTVTAGLVGSSITGTTVLNKHEWYHIALTRSGTTVRLFVNGVLEATSTSSSNMGNSSSVYIGTSAWLASAEEMNGYISNLRIVKGTALYTSSFTPDDSPLTNVTNTSLLTCQSNRFIDNSSNGFTVSTVGSPKVTPFSPFKDDDARDITTDGGSAYFDGSSYLNTASGATALGTGNLTVEFWINTTDTSFNIMNPDSSTGAGFWGLMVQSGDLRWNNRYNLLNLWVVDGAPILDGAWHHVAVVKNSNVFKVFYDGVSQSIQSGSFSDPYNYPYSDGLRIGSGNLNNFTGYLSDIRLLAGTALYSSDFTPPTAPLTAVTNTKLLMNFQDAGIYDRSGINNLDTVGNAQIDTAVVKYGTGSMQFDGSGDGLSSSETTSFGFGSGDFTIEAWAYLTTNGVFNNIVSAGVDASNGYRLDISTSNNLRFLAKIGSWITVITGSTSLATGQWYHLAVTRNGNNFNLWVDGSSDATTVSNSGTIADPTTKTEVGAVTTNSLNRSFNGYLDDVRVTKGIARYTANFTAPDAALPKF